MKRDPDLIRRIALAIEGLQNGQYLSTIDGVEEYSFAAHVQWMVDAGLIEGKVQSFLGGGPPAAVAMRLTWSGCDFLDSARSDTLWEKAKRNVMSPTMSFSFDILKDWLKAEIRGGFPTLHALSK